MRTWAALGCVLLACGGDDSGTPDGGDASSNDVTTSDVGNDVSSSDSGDASVDTGPPGAPGHGNVSFTRDDLAGIIYAYIGAGFQITIDGGPFPPTAQPTCTAQVGSCCYIHYTQSDAGFVDPGTRFACAGTITTTDNDASLAQLKCTDAGIYTTASPNAWNDNVSLKATAAGAEIHTFSNAVAAAALFKNTNPKIASNTTLTISEAKDLVVTWTQATGAITLWLTAPSAVDQITCTSPTDQGTITVDHTLLAKMPQGKNGFAHLTRTETVPAACDNASVTITSNAEVQAGSVTFGP